MAASEELKKLLNEVDPTVQAKKMLEEMKKPSINEITNVISTLTNLYGVVEDGNDLEDFIKEKMIKYINLL